MAGNTYKQKTAEKKSGNTKTTTTKNTAKKSSPKKKVDLKDKINLLKDRRLHLALGLLLLIFSACSFLAFTSYLFVGDIDQSFFGPEAAQLREDGRSIENVLGWSGAALAQLFMYRWFGIGAYLLIPILILYGIEIVYQKKFSFLFRLSKALIFFTFWISFLLGYIALSFEDGDFITYICGGIGYEWADFFSSVIGVGTLFLIIFAVAVFLIYFFDITSFVGLKKKTYVFNWDTEDTDIEDEELTEIQTSLKEEKIEKKVEKEPIEKKEPEIIKTDVKTIEEFVNKVEEDDELKLIIKEPEEQKESIEKKEPTYNFTSPEKSTDITNKKETEEFEPSPFDTILDEIGKEEGNFPDPFPKRKEPLISIDSKFGQFGEEENTQKDNITEQNIKTTVTNNETTSTPVEKQVVKETPVEEKRTPINTKVESELIKEEVSQPIEIDLTPDDTIKKTPKDNKEGNFNFEVENTATEEEYEMDQMADYYENMGEQYDPTLTLRNFKLPNLSHLEDRSANKVEVSAEELKANKDKIVETLGNYKIGIKSIKATIGPTVTLYEIIPADGVRISKIKNLEDDIALSLAALGIRIIAPIPGKGTIGIEVPNTNREIVSARSVLGTRKFQESDMALPVVFGKTISNEVFMVDLAKMPHMLMAGATGQGKSVGLNILLASLLYKKHPSHLKFVLVDPKKVEFSIFEKIEKHYLAKLPDTEDAIITDTSKVIYTLNSLCNEMDQRYDLLKNARCRNLKEYNQKFIERKLDPEKGHRFIPYIVVIIDELADLMMTAGKEVETPIARLAQLARAIGIHLVVATQRPSVNVITGVIKANFPARVSFRVSSRIDSRTILDAGGADQLVGMGDMLFTQGMGETRLQCAFIDTPEIENIVDHIGNQQGYPTAFMLPEVVEQVDAETSDVDLSDRDALFEDAARVIVTQQQGSTSLLQRKLKLGYNRAGRIIDQLEAAGIVGPFEGSKAREVYVSDEYSLEQLLNQLK